MCDNQVHLAAWLEVEDIVSTVGATTGVALNYKFALLGQFLIDFTDPSQPFWGCCSDQSLYPSQEDCHLVMIPKLSLLL